MRTVEEGSLVIYQRFKGEVLWCRVLHIDSHIHLQDIMYPNAKIMKTKVHDKVQLIPQVVKTAILEEACS